MNNTNDDENFNFDDFLDDPDALEFLESDDDLPEEDGITIDWSQLEEEIDFAHHHVMIPIPKDFYCEKEDEMFKTCMDCGRDLLEDDCLYKIEKVYKDGVVLYEVAICMDCVEAVFREFSEDSRRLLEHYMDGMLNIQDRRETLMKSFRGDVSPWLAKCAITGKPREELKKYHIAGLFLGRNILCAESPIIFSEDAMGDVQTLLSKSTREKLKDYQQNRLGLPPEVKLLGV